jgi:uncharacterized protein YjbI with pentapeptide repeats
MSKIRRLWQRLVFWQRLALVAVAVLLLLWLAIWPLPRALYGYVKDPEQRATAEVLTRTGIIAGLAGLAGLGGLVVTAFTYRLSEQGHITDRYTKAIEQLGNDKLQICLGGIYALERIAIDSQRDHPTVVEVLSAFVRERSAAAASEQQTGNTAIDDRNLPTDVQAAATVLGRLPKRPGVSRGDLSQADLSGAELVGTNLSDAMLGRVNLPRAELDRADLSGARLVGADLSGAELVEADLSDAMLGRANLSGARLVGADLSNADLFKADLSGAELGRANLSGARLVEADLSDAWLDRADLSDAMLVEADLSGAQLAGADLSTVHGLLQRQVDSARGDSRTRLPPGLCKPDHWSDVGDAAQPGTA